MSTDPIELSRSSSVDRNGKRIGQIRWYVPVRPTQAAIALIEDQQATINAPFPGEIGNVLDRFENEPADDGVGTIVTGLYSSDKSYELLKKIDRDDQNYYAFQYATVTSEIEVPYAIRKKLDFAGLPSAEYLWYAATKQKKQPMERAFINVSVENWDLGHTRAVRKQIGLIHTIPVDGVGTQYKYEGVNVNQRLNVSGGKKIYDVTHTWLGDPGNNKATWPNLDPYLAFPNLDRGPFGEYYIKPPWDDQHQPPIFGVRYNVDQREFDGWESLPGVPHL